ncbi:MAG: FAD-binding protein [Oscillospiraceae bacterium]|jgi:flavin-dependent dehydrogenase|nr:FAD-binding protein [Oscillospiraceae bacterium]
MAEHYDAAIIGLGPAGATLARLLGENMRVAAIDKKSPGGEHTKPCGGLLAPDAQRTLSRFNLTLPKAVLVDPQIFAVKTLDTEQRLLRYYPRFYINLNREKFDAWLVSLIPSGVDIIDNAVCTGLRRLDDGMFEISFSQGGAARRVITAQRVIGADGAGSIVRRTLFPKSKIRRYTAIQQWFKEKHATPFYSCVFDKSITDAYCWSVSKDGYFILGGAFPTNGAQERFEVLKNTLTERGFELGEPIKTEACLVSYPRRIWDFRLGEAGAFLIGEAAGFISPSSLEGISYALDSANRLAEVITASGANENRRYARAARGIKAKLLLKYIKSRFMYKAMPRKLIMKSGLQSIKVAE